MNKFITFDLQQIQQSLMVYLQRHWKIFLAEGVFFVVLGALAIIAPHIFTMGITLFLGWLLLVGGIVQIIRAVSVFNMPGFSLWFFAGILQAIIGYFLLSRQPTLDPADDCIFCPGRYRQNLPGFHDAPFKALGPSVIQRHYRFIPGHCRLGRLAGHGALGPRPAAGH